MSAWSLFDRHTGQIAKQSFSGPPNWRPRAPDGFALLEGEYDHRSQRVDIETGKVIDYVPPQPSDEHEWNADSRRWVLRPDVAARRAAAAEAQLQIEQLERQQLRPLRELAIDPTNADARARIDDIEAQIAALRENLGATGHS